MLLDWTGSPWSIAGLLAAAYVLSLVLIAYTPETKGRRLPRHDRSGACVNAGKRRRHSL